MENEYELFEKQWLSPYAVHSDNIIGRLKYEEKDPLRTEFQRDRDRVLHCNTFRRLKHKTQVFLSPQGDHYRTRLTHTLEVAQIARTITRALRLNEDLAEAIAIAHDLGHTPFGHAGERALNEHCDIGFSHTIQSVRVVDHIEKNGEGLNLTYEVKNGIACHSDNCPQAKTLEGQIVRLADKIAYTNHDIEDAIRAEILRDDDLPYDSVYVLGRTKSERITTIITSIVENSKGKNEVKMADEVLKAHLRLKQFMFDVVYTNPVAKCEEGKAQHMVVELYDYFYNNPDKLPILYKDKAAKYGLKRVTCDYVSGMTDQFAVYKYKELYIPKVWTVN